ncbi:MAG: hypothetical protein ABIX28_18175 [Vicinamibacterales bacterium]
MSLNQRTIGIVVLFILSALPVSGTLCAVLCDSTAASRAAAHHGSGTPCNDGPDAASSSGLQVRNTAGHDCSAHDAVRREAATTAAARADSVSGPSLLVAVNVHRSLSNLAGSDAVFDYRTPPASTQPTAFPLVLRV